LKQKVETSTIQKKVPNSQEHSQPDEVIEELKGSLGFQHLEDKLMHSVLESDKENVDDAKLLESSMDQGLGSFHPDLMMEKMVQNYQMAKDLTGETILQLLSSYDPDYIEKNIHIPEFQRELKQSIERKVEDLKNKGLLNQNNAISEKGRELALLHLFVQELDKLESHGLTGERVHKKVAVYGEKGEIKPFKKGDRYGDIHLRKSIRTAIRRGHNALHKKDLKTVERQSKGSMYVIYGLDASGSMKGKKLAAAKKAGLALAYKALQSKDKVGLVVYETELRAKVIPTDDFPKLARTIVDVNATQQTDMKKMIETSFDLFPDKNATKHLILLTDGLPTVGDDPKGETLQAVAMAKEQGITTSVVGLGMDAEGETLAQQMIEIGEGRFYSVKDLEMVDAVVLEDYYSYY